MKAKLKVYILPTSLNYLITIWYSPNYLKTRLLKTIPVSLKLKRRARVKTVLLLTSHSLTLWRKLSMSTVCARTQTVHKYVLTVYENWIRAFGTTNCLWVCVGNANCLWVCAGKQTVYEYVQGTQTEYVSGTQTVYEYEVRTRTVYEYVLGTKTVC